MKRKIIKIDEEKCNGCGLCIPECHEGAIRIIEGKARLVSDLFCDGLGACLGSCPLDAIIIEERDAEPYSETRVIDELITKPHSVLMAHLDHLVSHGEENLYNEALNYLKIKGISGKVADNIHHKVNNVPFSCPGSMMIDRKNENLLIENRQNSAQKNIVSEKFSTQFELNDKILNPENNNIPMNTESNKPKSELRQWPIQLLLVRPEAPYFKHAELVIMSTCAPLSMADVHNVYLKDRSVVVACPKLDNTEPYTEKLAQIFRLADTPKVIIVIMEVPCCRGLSRIAQQAAILSERKDLNIEEHIVSIDGTIRAINKVYY